MSLTRNHSFWGSLSPLGGLFGAGILLMASARLSWAITVAVGLFWVYGLTAFTFTFFISGAGKKIFPKKGRVPLYTCFAAFFGTMYLFMFWMLCSFAALEVFMVLLLVPVFCASSGIVQQMQLHAHNPHADIFDNVSDSISQAASIAGLLIAFSIIREPLSYCSLSFPGTSQGMVTIMYFKAGAYFPIGIFGASCGALLLLGYFICLYQYWKDKRGEF
ncbi:MAG: hypothetical protein FWB77_00135 [Treponema sp.]|nr:hypothetical protein [Treponema sp.]